MFSDTTIVSKKYNIRGVSATKDDVHNAITKLDKGLFPNSFCKIFPDYLTNSDEHCLVSHSDGAGTKSILTYLYWKLTRDLSVWKDIVQDSIVMNTDDLLCAGITDNMCFTSTIGRNKNLIDGKVISEIINGTAKIFEDFSKLGIHINFMGGETADVGDLVRTIIIDGTLTARTKRSEIIDNSNIKAGDVIIGFSSYGQSTYESEYNSGIGSNGITSARHDLLNKFFELNFPESYDPKTPTEFRFNGKYNLLDIEPETGLSVGKLLLSPTRTYLPIVKEIFNTIPRKEIHGMVHCTGGGQTKVLNFIDKLHIVKDNLFEIPPIFRLIKEENENSLQEMYQVFNMGHRLEIYVEKGYVNEIINISKNFNVDAKIIGRVEESEAKKLTLITNNQIIEYK